MMEFEIIDRPEKNRRKKPPEYDDALVSALLQTLVHGRAIRVLLSRFHCSPAKGRIWQMGYRVRHRVLEDDLHVAAWVEKDEEEPEPELVTGLLPLGA
jgi:hypothetical protein